MFIDRVLIEIAQWCVRQLELLTPVSRKKFISFLLWWFIVTAVLDFLAVLLYSAIVISPYQVLRGFLILLWMLYYFRHTTRELRSQQDNDALPKVIWERRWVRMVYLSITLAFFSVLCLVMAKFLVKDRLFLGWVEVFLDFSPWLLLAPIEYLLCTISLPPGEKERRKQEREMRDISLQGA